MSSYPDLGPIGQEYIEEEEYKALYGYPNGKVNYSLDAEVPGTSRPFILQNQIYSQTIPIPAPTDLGSEQQASIGGITVSYKASTAYPYIKYYIAASLSNNDLSTATDGGALTWWFEGANLGNSTQGQEQVTNNILNKGVPTNLDPGGGYGALVNINGTNYSFGNAIYPWTYNVNSGIVLFTGNNTGGVYNSTPMPTDTVTMTFWRYEGTIGSGGGGDSVWNTNGNNIYNSNTGNVGIGTTTPSALLDIDNTSFITTITASNASVTTYNPFVNSTTTTNYKYYLYYSTDKTQNLTGTFSSNKNIIVNVLVVGAGSYGGTAGPNGGSGGGAGAVIYGSFEVQANTTYTIQSGYAPNDFIPASQPSFISLNGNNIVSAGVGNPSGENGGASGTPSYDANIFTSQGASTSADGGATTGASGSSPGGGGGLSYNSDSKGGNGGLCFPNNGSSNTSLIFADGQASNILFGGGGGGGGGETGANGGSGGSGGGGLAGGSPSVSSNSVGLGGGGGGGGGFIGSSSFGSFTNAAAGGNASPTVSGNGGQGGIGGGGGGNGQRGGTGVTTGSPGYGGNGVVLIYFTTVSAPDALNATGNVNVTGNIVATGTITAGSDYRIKKEIKPLLLEDYSVDNLRPVIYKQIDTNRVNMGLIAHELQEYFPFLVIGEKDGEQTQSVNYMGLIGLLIKEVQSLKGRVKELEYKKI